MSESKCDINEEVIKSNKDLETELLRLTATVNGRTAERFSCRYRSVLLPLVKDLKAAEVLFWYLTGDIDLSKHVVLFPDDERKEGGRYAENNG